MSWRQLAACRGLANDLFFYERTGISKDHHNHVVSTCQSCVVRAECLDYAMETFQPAGVWGGLTPRQRRALRKKEAA